MRINLERLNKDKYIIEEKELTRVLSYIKSLESRIDKVLDYIKNVSNNGMFELRMEEIEEVLNILKGSDINE